MATYLDEILAHKRGSLRNCSVSNESIDRVRALPAARDFKANLKSFGKTSVAIICEIKFASPKKGTFAKKLDVAKVAQGYEKSGAAAISVLTDNTFFKGSYEYLKIARGATDLPILRKDFLLSPFDVIESRQLGADAILLIASALKVPELAQMIELAHYVGLQVLLEVHDLEEYDAIKHLEFDVLGVNQRDLKTFAVDEYKALELSNHIRPGLIKVAESGIESALQVVQLRHAGYEAVLIGEAMIKSLDQDYKPSLMQDIKEALNT